MGDDLGLGLRFGADVSRGIVTAADTNAMANSIAASTNTTTIVENEGGDENNNGEEEFWEEEEKLPVISIELELLVGYKPSTVEEIESIKKQLIEAMWMRYKSSFNINSNGDQSDEETKEQMDKKQAADTDKEADVDIQPSEEEPPPDFDDQIKELLDSRVARFGAVESGNLEVVLEDDDTTTAQNAPPSPFLEIMYPSRILPPNTASTEDQTNTTVLENTARLWSDIRSLAYALDEEIEKNYEYQNDEANGENDTPNPNKMQKNNNDNSFLYHLSDHLEHTGRLLSWKHSMSLELKDMLFRESLHKKHELWVREQRTAKLEQLYQVRETLVHRTEGAKFDFDKLVVAKDNAIRRDMLQYDYNLKRKKRGEGSSLLGGGELSFPEEFELMGLLPKDSQLYEEEDWGGTLDDDDDFDYYNSDYSDEYSDDDDDGYGSDSDRSGFSGDKEGGDDHEQRDPLPPIAPKSDDSPSNPIATANTESISPDDDNINDSDTALDGIGKEAPAAVVPKPFWNRNRQRRKKKARARKKKELAETQRHEEIAKRNQHEAFLKDQHTTNELVLAQTLLEALEKKVKDVEELLENLQEEEWAAEEEAEQQQEEQAQNIHNNTTTDKNATGMSLLDQILAMILGALPMEAGTKDRERHFRYVKEEHEFIVNGWKDYFGRLPKVFVPGEQEHPQQAVDDDDDLEDALPSGNPITTTLSRKIHKPIAGFTAPPSEALIKLSKITSKKTAPANTPANTVVATPQEQRRALGIVDNEDADWDTLTDDDDE